MGRKRLRKTRSSPAALFHEDKLRVHPMADAGVERSNVSVIVFLVAVIAVLLGMIYDNRTTSLAEAYVEKAVQFIENNKHLKTYSNDHIGWLAKDASSSNVTDHFLQLWESTESTSEAEALLQLLSRLPSPGRFTYLLFPGLLTQWYPGYMSEPLKALNDAGLDIRYVPLNTDTGVEINANFIRKFIQRILDLNPESKIVCIGHSKGVVDSTAALAMFPDIAKNVVALVSLQSPYAGSTIVHDLSKTEVQKYFAKTMMQGVTGGSFEAVTDLSYDNRRSFLKKHPFPSKKIPSISLATCIQNTALTASTGFSALIPMIDYMALRYGGACSDGCVTSDDAVIPGSLVVYLDDMDHFGPAFKGIPATDKYAPSRLFLSLLVVLHERKPGTFE